jgi:hypothetical protein
MTADSFFFALLPENIIFFILDEWVGSSKCILNFDSAVVNSKCRKIYLSSIGGNSANSRKLRGLTFAPSKAKILESFRCWIKKRNAFQFFNTLSFDCLNPFAPTYSDFFLAMLTSVKTLAIANTSLTVMEIFNIFQKCQSLCDISLTNVIIRGTLNDLKIANSLSSNHPQRSIQALSMSEVISLDDNNVIITLCRLCPSIEVLRIVICTNCTSLTVVRDILPTMPNVKDFTFCSIVPDDDSVSSRLRRRRRAQEWFVGTPLFFFPSPLDEILEEETTPTRTKYQQRAHILFRSYVYGQFPTKTFPNIKRLHLYHPEEIHSNKNQFPTILRGSDPDKQQVVDMLETIYAEDMLFLLPSMIALEAVTIDLRYVTCREQIAISKWEAWLQGRMRSVPLKRCEIGLPLFGNHAIDAAITCLVKLLDHYSVPVQNFSLKANNASEPIPAHLLYSMIPTLQLHTENGTEVYIDDTVKSFQASRQYPLILATLLDPVNITSYSSFTYRCVKRDCLKEISSPFPEEEHADRATTIPQLEEATETYSEERGLTLFASLHGFAFDDIYYPLHQLRHVEIYIGQSLCIPHTMDSHIVNSLLKLVNQLLSWHEAFTLPMIERISICAPNIICQNTLQAHRDITHSMIPYRWRCKCPYLAYCHIDIPFFFNQQEVMERYVLPRMRMHCPKIEYLSIQLSIACDEKMYFENQDCWKEYCVHQQQQMKLKESENDHEEQDEDAMEEEVLYSYRSSESCDWDGKEDKEEEEYEYEYEYDDSSDDMMDTDQEDHSVEGEK